MDTETAALEFESEIVPEVGMGATMLMYSDRHPFTIVEVFSPTKIKVQADTFRRCDDNGMSEDQRYLYAPNPTGETYLVYRGKKGWIVRSNRRIGLVGGQRFAIGYRREYRDFSF